MNSLSIQTQQTMSSTEIATLTGKEKKNVHRDIRIQILEGLYDIKDGSDLSHIKIQGVTAIFDERGYVSDWHLDKEHTFTLFSGYDVKMRHAINKRWLELEQQAAKPIDPMQVLNDPAAMRGLLLTYAETVIEKDKVIAEKDEVIAEQTPKVAALELLSESQGSLCLRDAAKTLKIPPQKFNAYLNEKKYIYKRGGVGDWIAHQPRIQSGILEHKPVSVPIGNGKSLTKSQVVVTSKGLTKLAAIFGSTGGAATGVSNHA